MSRLAPVAAAGGAGENTAYRFLGPKRNIQPDYLLPLSLFSPLPAKTRGERVPDIRHHGAGSRTANPIRGLMRRLFPSHRDFLRDMQTAWKARRPRRPAAVKQPRGGSSTSFRRCA